MHKMRIAFFTDSYYPAVDGVVSYINLVREELERRGHEVYIFAAGNGKTQKLVEKDKKLFVFRGIPFPLYKQYTISISPLMGRKIREIEPDLIHAQTPAFMGIMALIASKWYSKPFISTFHTLINSEELIRGFVKNEIITSASKTLIDNYIRWFYSVSGTVIVPSESSRSVLLSMGINNIYVIPNGIKIGKRIRKSYARQIIGIKRNEKVILYLGRISHEKNLDLLLSVADRLEKNDIMIIIAGDGPYLDKLKHETRLLRLSNVKFTGFVPEEKKALYYSAADLFINPSNFETFSIVDLEAMSNGLPILVPSGTAQEEYLRSGKCGEAFRKNDGLDLYEKVLYMIENTEEYTPFNCAKKYSVEKSVSKLMKVYESLLKQK